MKNLLILGLVAAVAVAACSNTTSDDTDMPLAADGAAAPDPRAPTARAGTSSGSQSRDVTVPAGTTLPLALTRALDSGASTVGDLVTAEVTRTITIDGRDVLPAGTSVTGTVTEVDGSGRVKGRAMITFRFTALTVGGTQYAVQTEPVSYLADATKGEDAVKVGIGAGAGAVIGGILGGKKGAATGAAVGGGAGTGVVLATKGQEVQLAPGADATTRLSGPMTVRVRVS